MSSAPLRLRRQPDEGSTNRWPAFETAIAEHHGALHAFAYRVLGGRTEAEDALQTAYLKAFRAVRAGEINAALSLPWLYRVVYHCCIDELRRVARNRHDVLDETLEAAGPREAPADLVRALSEALLHLSGQTRAAVLLVDVHGLTYDEAAAALEVPRGTIASRLNHGRDALRAALASYEPQRRDP